MIKSIYTASSGMLVNEMRQEVVANNLANVNTTGYKKNEAVFKSFGSMLLSRVNDYEMKVGHIEVDKNPLVGKLGTGVIVDEVVTKFSDGAMIQTDNDFNYAIKGDGFFVVNTKDDGYKMTRKGNFTTDKQGFLTDLHGNRVMVQAEPVESTKDNVMIDKDGNLMLGMSEFKIPENTKIIADKNGSLFNKVTAQRLGFKIALAKFDNKAMQKQGHDLWQLKGNYDIKADLNSTINQGYLESSNVNAIEEMVKLISVQRTYEANQRVVSSTDRTLEKDINSVGRSIG